MKRATLLGLLLLPAVALSASPILVVAVEGADLPLAHSAAAELVRDGAEAKVVALSRYLELASAGCAAELTCLCAAKDLSGSSRVFVFATRKAAAKLQVVDLQLIDCANHRRVRRLSEALPQAQLSEWLSGHTRRWVAGGPAAPVRPSATPLRSDEEGPSGDPWRAPPDTPARSPLRLGSP